MTLLSVCRLVGWPVCRFVIIFLKDTLDQREDNICIRLLCNSVYFFSSVRNVIYYDVDPLIKSITLNKQFGSDGQGFRHICIFSAALFLFCLYISTQLYNFAVEKKGHSVKRRKKFIGIEEKVIYRAAASSSLSCLIQCCVCARYYAKATTLF